MAELSDVTINDDLFMLSAYERSAEAPAPSKPGRLSLSTFNLGLGWAEDASIPDGAGGGWSGSQVHSVHGGSGLEPWPTVTTYADILSAAPLKTLRTIGVLAANRVYFNIDRHLYRTSGINSTNWSAVTIADSFTAGTIMTDLAYHRDDVLICSGPSNNIVRYNTGTGTPGTWRSGEECSIAHGVAGALAYTEGEANAMERFALGLTTNGGGLAAKNSKWIDAPIVRMGLFNGQLVIATRLSLFLLDGYPFTETSVAADATWEGQPRPLLGHGTGVNTRTGDFVFLQSFLGRLYTWLAGSVVVFDPASDGRQWRRIGPTGVACYGAAIGESCLVVELETAAGRSQVWAFDGQGWWLIDDAAASSSTYVWPVALHGAGDYDVMWFIHNSTAGYKLARLTPKPGKTTYPASGSWTSPLLAAGNADATKAWRRVAAYFSWPEAPGTAGSADAVTITLEYSTDAGASWTTADTASVSIANTHQLVAELSPPPTSRLLQLRVSWSSVGDWAPILSRVIADYAVIDTSPRRRTWKLKITARDKNVRRDSGVLPLDGRQQIDALWEAWRDETTVTLRDVDYDEHPTELTVRVLDIAEASPKPSDAGRWADGTVTVTLGEV